MTRRKQPVLIGLPAVRPGTKFWGLGRQDLEFLCDVLNRKLGQDTQREAEAQALIGLMERLKKCGGNLLRMMDGDPQLLNSVREACTAFWLPTKTGRAYLVLQPPERVLLPLSPKDIQTPEEYAAMLFHVWTLNPEWDKLAGPCARCGRYYIKKRASQKVYCSAKCGSTATAIARTREKLEQERNGKIKRAKASLREWRKARTKEDWKIFVSRKTGIDKRFLTRHETELKPAKGR